MQCSPPKCYTKGKEKEKKIVGRYKGDDIRRSSARRVTSRLGVRVRVRGGGGGGVCMNKSQY